ncbi:hypothetical protein L1987_43849 [Smallanthus sonchifolius]|uniref:Uncharacterized protein n=1 Tax=Smallanthus sonchifolius TaxID=185202 RepID=A0ACB9GMS3_9ASTR|nr:hypothetical protein L1987_43849 [Smallanthus sonchifolius]
MLQSGQRTGRKKSVGRETVYSTHLNGCPSHNCLTTKATVLLEAQYSFNMEPDAATCVKKPRGKNMTKWHRCDCPEHIFPSQHHCVNCHETFFTTVEFEHHKNSTCEITLYPGHDGAHATSRTGFS